VSAAGDAWPEWPAVRIWRAAARATLLAERAALTSRVRRQRGELALQRLLAAVRWPPSSVLGIYWPIRGEIDVREIARRHVEAGGIAALPVVTQKNDAVEFWQWRPGMKMTRGFWRIPVPAARHVVQPDVLIIPLVGFDAAGFRLGYGGGYYDRTLAALTPRPLRIGIGFTEAALPTIYPQPHDVPMTLIVTDGAVHEAAADADAARRG
jgi:5-formyltetrahydrofolate cyclo-ligase